MHLGADSSRRKNDHLGRRNDAWIESGEGLKKTKKPIGSDDLKKLAEAVGLGAETARALDRVLAIGAETASTLDRALAGQT